MFYTLAPGNFFHTVQTEKKEYTIEIVWLKNGRIETIGITWYFYHMGSEGGEPNHSLLFLLNVTKLWFIR